MNKTTCTHCGAPVGMAAVIKGLGFGPTMRRALLFLAAHPGEMHVSDRLADAVYADDPGGGPDDGANSIRVAICRHRKRLSAAGIELVSKHGRGGGYALRWAA